MINLRTETRKIPVQSRQLDHLHLKGKKYTKKLKEIVKQRRRGHYKGNKYYPRKATHRYNTRAKGTRVEPKPQHVAVLAKNMQGYHQANVAIDPTTGASIEYSNIIKGPTKAIHENSFTNKIG